MPTPKQIKEKIDSEIHFFEVRSKVENEIVKSDILPGGLGNIWVNGKPGEITMAKSENGLITLTISPIKKLVATTEDVDFETVEPKMIENEK